MREKLKKILVLILALCLFQTNFYIARAEDKKTNDTYAINITEPYGGDVYTDPEGEAEAGEEVYITAEPFEGFVVKSISVINDSTSQPVTCTNNTFKMPDSSVTITVTFGEPEYYNVVLGLVTGGDNVLYNTESGKAVEGQYVYVGFDPWEGYQAELSKTTIVDDNGNDVSYDTVTLSGETYVRFVMPSSNVTFTPSFSTISGYKFSIDTSGVPEGAAIKFYRENAGTWEEITDGKFVGGENIKYVITLNQGITLRRVLITYVDQRTGNPVTLNSKLTALEGTFTAPYANITATISLRVSIEHCSVYSEDGKTCDVCDVGYERSADGKKCSQGIPKSFATDDWRYVNECALDVDNCPYKVGDTREITVGNNTYTLRIANMDTKPACTFTSGYSETACGFVIEFTKCITEMDMNVDYSTNKRKTDGSWTTSDAYTYMNDVFLPLLKENTVKQGSTKLGDIMIPTRVVTGSNYGEKQKGRSTWTASNQYLYLLSLHEIYEGTATETKSDVDFTVSSMDNGYSKTHQLQYYEGLKTTDEAGIKGNYMYKEASTGGSGRDWWLRTPSNQKENNSTHYYCASQQGGAGYKRSLSNVTGYATTIGISVVTKGIAPAFRVGKVLN